MPVSMEKAWGLKTYPYVLIKALSTVWLINIILALHTLTTLHLPTSSREATIFHLKAIHTHTIKGLIPPATIITIVITVIINHSIRDLRHLLDSNKQRLPNIFNSTSKKILMMDLKAITPAIIISRFLEVIHTHRDRQGWRMRLNSTEEEEHILIRNNMVIIETNRQA